MYTPTPVLLLIVELLIVTPLKEKEVMLPVKLILGLYVLLLTVLLFRMRVVLLLIALPEKKPKRVLPLNVVLFRVVVPL